jgi:hypothetical protein
MHVCINFHSLMKIKKNNTNYYLHLVPFIIQEPQNDFYQDKNLIDNDNEFKNNKKSNISKATSSSSGSTSIGEELKIDPNYSWILKDLNLNDNKRVIDVTDLIEKKKEEEGDDELEQQKQQQQMVNQGDLNSKLSKNETLQDALTSLINDPIVNNKFICNDDTEEDNDDDDDKLLEEQLTNILSTRHNPNYESVDVDNVYYSHDYEDKIEDVEEGKLLKTSTFKLLSPFNAELFSDTDTESELEEVKMGIYSEFVRHDDEKMEESEDEEDFYDDDDNIKSLQKKYQKIIKKTITRSDESDNDDDFKFKKNFEVPKISKKLPIEPKIVDNEEKFIIKNSQLNNNNNNNGNFKKFSKSFEVSLNDLDDRIGRLNNEIKIKRNGNIVNVQDKKKFEEEEDNDDDGKKLNTTYELKDPSSISYNGKQVNTITDATPSISISTSIIPSAPTQYQSQSPQKHQKTDLLQQEQQRQQEVHVNMIETMKKEWSQVIDKLQIDYKMKLEDQQRTHEEQLKSLYDEIKKSIKIKQQTNELPKNYPEVHKSGSNRKGFDNNNFVGNFSFSTSSLINDSAMHTQTALNNNNNKKNTQSIDNLVKEIDINQLEKNDYLNNIKNFNRSISNDPNYVSNLRLSLKTKHSRHIQDLKSYYESEIEDLKKELQKAQTKFRYLKKRSLERKFIIIYFFRYSSISGATVSSQFLNSSIVDTPRKYTEQNKRSEDATKIAELKNQNLISLKKLVINFFLGIKYVFFFCFLSMKLNKL